MANDVTTLAGELMEAAESLAGNAGDAAAALFGAALAILCRDMGTPATIEHVRSSLDEAAAQWRRRSFN